ncbi:MAG: chromate transporter [Bacteroidales bacterium]|nr:chromate transporter [Bacteroidales bacterium]
MNRISHSGSYLELFLTFAKVGAFTIGGGLAMVSVIHDDLVTKKKWLDDEEFMDILAIAQTLPGLLAVNFSIFLGFRLKGTKGAILSTLGSILPPFVIILLIAMVFTSYKDIPAIEAIFKGIRPAVVALIAVPTIKLAVKGKLNWLSGTLALLTMLTIALLRVSPIYIILTVGIIAAAIAYFKERRQQ